MKKYLLILVTFLVITTACKYDDGPFISIYTKTERIAGRKTFKNVRFNDEDKTSEYSMQNIEFSKTGYFTRSFYTQAGYDYGFSGDWELSDDKKIITMETYEYHNGNDTTYIHNWTIKRLTYADMHLERTDENGNLIRWELYQAY